MSKLLLFIFLFSRDTIITSLAPHPSITPRSSASQKPAAATAAATIALRILNTAATPLARITLEWSLETNGSIRRKGKTHIPLLKPNHPTLVRLPLRLPDDTAGESFLLLRYHSANPSALHPQRTTTYPTRAPQPPPSPTFLAEQQLQLTPYHPTLTIPPAGEMTPSDENDIFTIHSPTILISFNRQTGWLVHYEIKGIDLLDDTSGLRPNFWWPGYNDSAKFYTTESARRRDSTANYTITIDSGWEAATRDPHLQLFSNTTSPDQIIIRTEYTLPATASLLHLSYTINAAGEMLITQHVEPDTTQPPSRPWPMPCFGMQWFLPPGYDSITAYGPFDSAGIAIFHDHPTTPSTSDLQARAASTHTNIRWWTITDKEGNGLEFIADTTLVNESALTTATHPGSPPQIQINIDHSKPPAALHPTPSMPAAPPPIPPMGNLRYTYKVKPLIASTNSSTHL